MDPKNYYKALGVSPQATNADIKQAFKKLSLKYHPDRQHGKTEEEIKNAEEQFKIINEAYSVLGDEEKRQSYDMSGNDYDIFGGFSGFRDPFYRARTTETPPERGRDIKMRVPVTIYELYNGVDKKVKYKRYIRCVNCHGAGGFNQKNCDSCHGTGYFVRHAHNGGMIYTQTTTCPACKGTGTAFANVCSTCKGERLMPQDKTIEIKIPKFMPSDFCIEKVGEGNESPNIKGSNGNFYAEIYYAPEANYETKGTDVYEHIRLPYYELLLGIDYTVNIPNGSKIKIHIPSCIKEGTVINVGKCGLESHTGIVGNYFVVVHYDFPESLTAEDKKLIESIKVNAYKSKN